MFICTHILKFDDASEVTMSNSSREQTTRRGRRRSGHGWRWSATQKKLHSEIVGVVHN